MKKEVFNTLIGKTQLSWYLDTEHRKDNISASALEVYYDEIYQIVKESNAKVKKNEEQKTIVWIRSYWKELKQFGMSQKQLIQKFDKYLNSFEF